MTQFVTNYRDSHAGISLESYRNRFEIPPHRDLSSTTLEEQQPEVSEPAIAQQVEKQNVPTSKRKRSRSASSSNASSDVTKRPRGQDDDVTKRGQDDLDYIEAENKALQGHWYTGVQVSCPVSKCGAVFYDADWLRRHLAVSHGVKKPGAIAQEATYACLACKKLVIHQKSSIASHLDDDHRLPLEDYAKYYGLEVIPHLLGSFDAISRKKEKLLKNVPCIFRCFMHFPKK